eukprot:470289_1
MGVSHSKLISNESNNLININTQKHVTNDTHDINTCKHIRSLSTRMSQYKHKNDHEVDSSIFTDILNDYFHIFFYHCNTDCDFNKVCQELGGECIVNQCKKLKRHYCSIFPYDTNKKKHLNFYKELMDTIHSEFAHGVQLFKMKKKERKYLDDICETKKNDENDSKYDEQDRHQYLLAMKQIMTSKIEKFLKNTNFPRFTAINNKFNNNMGETFEVHDDYQHPKEKNTTPTGYSFGINFAYWKSCINSKQKHNGVYLSDLYVGPKFTDLKDELLNNNLEKIDIQKYENAEFKAQQQMQTDQYKSVTATFGKGTGFDDDPKYYGYENQECMKLKHLISVIIYCSADQYQSKYSETYREMKENEAFEEIKNRHKNFHHFAKSLKEAVELFGTCYIDTPQSMLQFYHGINQEMTFAGTSHYIYSVLSTSTDFIVSQTFATTNGLIVQMIPTPKLKYFSANWLSKYPNEQECIFIGGQYKMNFINIIKLSESHDYKKIIASIRLLESMFSGNYFALDPTLCVKSQKNKSELKMLRTDTSKYDIPQEIKDTVCQLLQPDTYANKNTESLTYFPIYIQQLLSHICNEKINVTINIQSLKIGLQERLNPNGYIGYDFAQKYIC